MARPKNDLTAEQVRALFRYDKKTGNLYWKKTVGKNRKSRGGNSRAGKLAGHVFINGYRYVKIGPRVYLIHRIIFLLQNGEWPADKIDHATGNPLNNKKIRPANNSQNNFNQKKSKRNTSGYKGVSFHAGAKKWRAQIVAYGQYESLGLYATKQEAHSAYCKAAKRVHGEFANFG